MRLLRFLALMVFAPLAGAATVSDHWWNPDSPGYGVMLDHVGDGGYAMLYDYGADGSPRWYIAPSLDRYGSTQSGQPALRGDLYRVDGTPYGAPYDPARRGQVRVGTINLEPHEVDRMLVVTTIDGVERAQDTRRLTQAAPEYGYRYLGGFSMRRVVEGNPVAIVQNYFAPFDVERNGDTLQMQEVGSPRACVYSGIYRQAGRLGSAVGTYRCDETDVGTFTVSEIEATGNGISGRLERRGTNYREYGRFGGVMQYSHATGPLDD